MRCPEHPTETVEPTDAVVPVEPADEVVLSVPGMTCRHCARAVSARVGDVAGVVAVQADVTSGTVRVRGAADVEALRSAAAQAGHEVTQVSR